MEHAYFDSEDRRKYQYQHDISITILGVNGKQVTIGINAPKEVPVHREEGMRRIQAGLPNTVQINDCECPHNQ